MNNYINSKNLTLVLSLALMQGALCFGMDNARPRVIMTVQEIEQHIRNGNYTFAIAAVRSTIKSEDAGQKLNALSLLCSLVKYKATDYYQEAFDAAIDNKAHSDPRIQANALTILAELLKAEFKPSRALRHIPDPSYPFEYLAAKFLDWLDSDIPNELLQEEALKSALDNAQNNNPVVRIRSLYILKILLEKKFTFRQEEIEATIQAASSNAKHQDPDVVTQALGLLNFLVRNNIQKAYQAALEAATNNANNSYPKAQGNALLILVHLLMVDFTRENDLQRAALKTALDNAQNNNPVVRTRSLYILAILFEKKLTFSQEEIEATIQAASSNAKHQDPDVVTQALYLLNLLVRNNIQKAYQAALEAATHHKTHSHPYARNNAFVIFENLSIRNFSMPNEKPTPHSADSRE